jgi:large conductance mechanosensitive channel
MGFVKEFKEFINRGNVVDLAVAVVIGASFKLVIDSFSVDIIGGILSAIGGQPDLSGLTVTVGEGEIYWGRFVTAVINFIITAFAVFLVVKAINKMQNLRAAKAQAEEEATETELDLLRQIRDQLAARP